MRFAIDTNVLAYAEGLGDERRCGIALELIQKLPGDAGVLPAQVLGELSRVLTTKAKRSTLQARDAVLAWADTFEVADSTWFAFQAALDLTVDHQLQMWDALILTVAAEQHCRIVISEDF
jgi:predicted nucleic acid-binding protein